MENEKPNYYAIIPAEVRYDNSLKDKAKLLYGEITALSDKNGYCYASNRYFAELYNVSQTTISMLIKNLIDNGYIESEIIYKEGSKEILNRYLKIIKGGYLKNFKEGIKENLKDNNTSNNNTSNNNKKYKKEIEIPYEEIVNYLNEKANTNFKYTTKNTQKNIKARYKENYTLEDFKKVIDNKTKEWLYTKYEIYLRPDTLFGEKFELYLHQKRKKTQFELIDEGL